MYENKGQIQYNPILSYRALIVCEFVKNILVKNIPFWAAHSSCSQPHKSIIVVNFLPRSVVWIFKFTLKLLFIKSNNLQYNTVRDGLRE